MSIADLAARTGANIALGLVGRTITYVRTGDPVEDLAAGTSIAPETEYSLKGYETKVEQRMIDGTRVKIGDRMVLIDAQGFEAEVGSGLVPTSDDRIKIGSRDLAIKKVFLVSSGEQDALHKVVVER